MSCNSRRALTLPQSGSVVRVLALSCFTHTKDLVGKQGRVRLLLVGALALSLLIFILGLIEVVIVSVFGSWLRLINERLVRRWRIAAHCLRYLARDVLCIRVRGWSEEVLLLLWSLTPVERVCAC